MPERSLNDFSVKEILTEFVMPALNDLRTKQEIQKRDTDSRLESLEAWKNKSLGAFLLIVALMVPLAVPVIAAAMR